MNAALLRLVRERAEDRCEYCRMSQAHISLPHEADHIIALKHHGPTVAGNLALACFACNSHKGPNIAGVDPDTQTITPLFHPRKHKWSKHLRWDGPELVGQTAIGRTTVAVLEINLPHRIALRQSLIDAGEFP